MDIDADTARALGWPKLKYAFIERERRWLCREVPMPLVIGAEHITDLYITGTHLRLREALPADGGPPMRRLSRKADAEASTRLLTSIYLSPEEFALLAHLPGLTLRKVRHRLKPIDGAAAMSVDLFEGPLAGLIMGEAEFDDDEAMRAFPLPEFAVCEVTDDVRYTGGELALRGLPG
jgi:hypothetical protein